MESEQNVQYVYITESELQDFDPTKIVYINEDQLQSSSGVNEVNEESKKTGSKARKTPARGKGARSRGSDENTTKDEVEVRFNIKIDIELLREVLCEMPMSLPYSEQAKCWKKIHRNIKSPFPITSLQRRFKTLLEKFKSEELNSLKVSGTDEERTERGDLLQEISDLLRDETLYPSAEERRKKDSKNEKELGEEIRNAAVTSMKSKDTSPQSSPPAPMKRKSVMDILAENQAEELKFKKLKFEQVLAQRDKDREVEMKRLELQQQFQESQNKIMMAMLEKLNKN